ncbi:Omega-hydroxypalmitate O-feruloyl transferase [Bertholletia excelsa]
MAAAQRQSPNRVSITQIVSVYPKASHPPKLINLSNLDRQCPVLMYLVFFYKPSSDILTVSDDAVFSGLKNGLEETLSAWYPAAGRLTKDSIDGKLNLWCNNGGALVVEAVSQVEMSELGDLSQYEEFYESLVFKPVVNGDMSEMPLVVAQVTRFRCGGYSLGIGTSHSLFDGPATYEFLCAWASASQSNVNNKGSQTLDDKWYNKPVHDRGRLLIASATNQTPLTQPNTSKSSAAMRVAAIDHLYQLIKEVAYRGHDHKDGGNFVLRTFRLDRAMIHKLKHHCTSGDKRGVSFSTFEVIAAHLWKARTKALELSKDRTACLQFAVDTRTRIVPPLPKGFSGNAFVLASIALKVGELEEETHEAIIGRIKEAKNSISNDYVEAYIKALEGPQAGNLPPLKELTIVSDWRRVPFHKINFLGKEAAYASPLVPPLPQVAYLMQIPDDTEGIDVRIGLLPSMEAPFSRYFLANLL